MLRRADQQRDLWLAGRRRKDRPKPKLHDVLTGMTMSTITEAILGLGTAALSVTAGAVLAVALGLIPLAS